MSAPATVKSEFSIQGHTGSQERLTYLILIGMGVVLAVVCTVLELVTVPDPNDHGFWTVFALLGAGIAVVFGYIVKHAQSRTH